MRPIAKLYAERGDIKAFLKAERYRLGFATKFPYMLPQGIETVLREAIEAILGFEKALQNPENAELSMVPFGAFELNASYSIMPEKGGYKVEVYASELNIGIVETIKGMLGNYGFEAIDYE